MAITSPRTPPAATDTTTAAEQPKAARRIACEPCRAAKVKCFKGNDNGDDKCRRCSDAAVECSFAPVVTRRRRKRTDARVTALEEELRKIKSTLEPSGESKPSPKPHQRRVTTANCLTASQKSNSDYGTHSSPASQLTPNDDPLAMISSLLSKDQAVGLLVDFVQHLLPQYPILAIADLDTYDSLEMEKPLLLLAIITAASGAQNQALFQELHSRLVETLTLRVFVRGEASLELVQSIMVMEVWYSAPVDVRRARFYQWIHAAATMALQLGLGEERSTDITSQRSSTAVTGPTEESRTLLSCFLLCSCVAVSMRKECILGLSPGVRHALNDLSKTAIDVNDRKLLALIRLQLIAEQGLALLSDQSQVSFNTYDVDSALSGEISRIHNQYEDWRRTLDEDVVTETLMVHFQYCKARLLEIPLHLRLGFDALVPPFTSKTPVSQDRLRAMTHSADSENASEVQYFVGACHALLQTFLATSPKVLAQCPNVTFIRAVYAVKALLMMEELIISLHNIRSIDASQLQVDCALKRVRGHIAAVYQTQTWTIPPLPVRILDQIASGYPKAGSATRNMQSPGTVDDSTDVAASMVDLRFSNREPRLQSQLDVNVSSSNDRNDRLTYILPAEDDITQWLSGTMELGKGIWDMDYFPWDA